MNARRDSIAFRGGKSPLIDIGEGPVVGYLHGPLGNPGVPEVITRLARRRRVIAPTLPGFFGADPCPQLRSLHDWVAALSEILDETGLAGAPVIASSVTAMLALELAAIRQEAFSHLILIAPLGLWDSAEPIADLFARLPGQETPFLVSDPAALSGIFKDNGIVEPARLVERSVWRFVARTTSASIVWPIPEFGLSDRIHRVRCPVTLLWGANDLYVPVGYAERFAKLLPNLAGRRVIEDAAHLADLDQPEAVADLAENILAADAVSA
jgi:pimeloyl-ACP methyl ester carboxylesterase